jgi:hypothetical protein
MMMIILKQKVKMGNPIGDVERFVCLDSSERRASWEVGPVSKKRKEERVRGRSETPRLLAGPCDRELGTGKRYDGERLGGGGGGAGAWCLFYDY